MPLDFPANPVDGQQYGSYVYNATTGAWQSREDSATVAVTGPTAPTSANNGDIWYNTNTGVSYIYYSDGTSSQWVEIVSSAVPALNTKADLSGATFTGNVTAPRFISTQSTGTSPLQVSSTTAVTNLNADLLDGQHASAFSPVAGSSSITTVGTITSGTWEGTKIAVASGGTGQTTLTSGGYLKGAGTGAITSQTGIPAGDITSGSLAVARGGSGVSNGTGLVPIIPGSVGVSSGSASVSATGKITFSGVGTINLNNIFSGDYVSYAFNLIQDSATVANTNIQARLRVSGSDLTSGYFEGGILHSGATVAGVNNVNQGIWNIGRTHLSSFPNGHAVVSFQIFQPFLARPTTFITTSAAWDGSQSVSFRFGGFSTPVTSYTGLSIFAASGTFGGTLEVYGYR
jgi:hypothetical protein